MTVWKMIQKRRIVMQWLMVDAIIVNNADDIQSKVKTKQEKVAMIQLV
jgi:hypothetical protein